MSNHTIDTLKSVTGTFIFTGGGIVLSLEDVESYLRITSLLVGTISTAVYLFAFIKKYKK